MKSIHLPETFKHSSERRSWAAIPAKDLEVGQLVKPDWGFPDQPKWVGVVVDTARRSRDFDHHVIEIGFGPEGSAPISTYNVNFFPVDAVDAPAELVERSERLCRIAVNYRRNLNENQGS